jgi:hypothetical protein
MRRLTSSFLLTVPGVEVQEVEPWKQGEEKWRRLRARFPAYIATHCQVQDLFFDERHLLRRHDYCVDVAGSFAAAQRVDDHTTTDGISVPTKRRAFKRAHDERAMDEFLMVSIDLRDIHFS